MKKWLLIILPVLAVLLLAAEPTYFPEGSLGRPSDNENRLLHKILGAVRDQTTSGSTVQTDGSQKTQVTRITGAPNLATGQVATSTTAGTLVAARATRRSVTIKNLHATITVYVGAPTVTASNGMEIKAGESLNIDTTALVQVIAASGTPTVAYVETYD